MAAPFLTGERSMNHQYFTDAQRVQVAKMEYQLLIPGQVLSLNHRYFGIVLQHIYTPDGFQAFVIGNRKDDPHVLTILFKGSSGLMRGTRETITNEWLNTNFPILWAMLFQNHQVPSQLTTAARMLNRLLKQYPHTKAFLYGHSLGAINCQYALAHCRYLGRIKQVSLYEGPNLFILMNHREQRRVRKFKHKVDNYVDVNDPVTLGYYDGRHLVGQLHYVDAEMLPPITAHMWGGYSFWPSGRLKTKPVDDYFRLTAFRQQQLMTYGRTMNASWRQWKLAAAERRAGFQDRLQSLSSFSVMPPEGEVFPKPDRLRKWWSDVVE